MLRGARAHLAWLAPLVVLILEAPLLWPLPHVGDWFYLWFAGHIVATGGSPFDIASWIPATRDYGVLAGGIAHNSIAGQDLSLATSDRWLWPPIVAFLLAPFGALPLWLGVPLLHLATIAMCVASALLLVRTLLPPPSRPLALALLIASAPAVEVMRAGNPAAFLLPGIALTYAALRTPSAVPLAAGALGIFVRWSLFPLAALGTAVAFLRRGAWRPLAVAATALVVIEVAAYALTPFSPAALLDARSMPATQDNASTWHLAGLAGATAPLV